MMTYNALEDTLTDYANEFGDIALQQHLIEWLNKHMGGTYKISNEADRTSSLSSKLEVINTLRNRFHNLKDDDYKYQLCKMDVMLILMEETINL